MSLILLHPKYIYFHIDIPNIITPPFTTNMDYDEACKMHLTPGVVHNFPKAVDV